LGKQRDHRAVLRSFGVKVGRRLGAGAARHALHDDGWLARDVLAHVGGGQLCIEIIGAAGRMTDENGEFVALVEGLDRLRGGRRYGGNGAQQGEEAAPDRDHRGISLVSCPLLIYGRCQSNHMRPVGVNRTWARPLLAGRGGEGAVGKLRAPGQPSPRPSPASRRGLAACEPQRSRATSGQQEAASAPENGGGNAMTTRRNFLKGAGAAGLAFCGCSM